MEMDQIYKDIDFLTNIARGFMPAEALLVANELGLFSIIGDEGKNLEAICGECNTDFRATEILLNALVGMDLLKKKKDFFENSFMTKEYLIPGKKYYQGDLFKHLYRVRARWGTLLDVLRTGRTVEPVQKEPEKSEEDKRSFIMGMANIAHMSAEKLISVLDLSQAGTLLDLGGGPGSYAISFCKKYPSLKATILDLPDVIPITSEQIEKYGVEGQIDTISGSFLETDYRGPYDFVLISNIIHMLGKEDIQILFQKSIEALSRNGTIVVKDFFVNEDRSGPEYAVLFAINMLVATQKGNTYTESEVSGWLAECGFKDIEFKEITPQCKIATGIKS